MPINELTPLSTIESQNRVAQTGTETAKSDIERFKEYSIASLAYRIQELLSALKEKPDSQFSRVEELYGGKFLCLANTITQDVPFSELSLYISSQENNTGHWTKYALTCGHVIFHRPLEVPDQLGNSLQLCGWAIEPGAAPNKIIDPYRESKSYDLTDPSQVSLPALADIAGELNKVIAFFKHPQGAATTSPEHSVRG